MSQLERNKKLIFSQHREIWSRSDPEAVDRYYAPEVTLHFAGRGVTGRSGIKALIEARRKAFADWHEEVEMVIAEGDFVSSRVTSTATHTGPFLGIKASNRRIQVAEMFLFRVQSDLIAECWGELDMLGLLSLYDHPKYRSRADDFGRRPKISKCPKPIRRPGLVLDDNPAATSRVWAQCILAVDDTALENGAPRRFLERSA